MEILLNDPSIRSLVLCMTRQLLRNRVQSIADTDSQIIICELWKTCIEKIRRGKFVPGDIRRPCEAWKDRKS